MPPFDVGDVVVCVDDRLREHSGKSVPQRIRKGNLYRVIGAAVSPWLRLPTVTLDGVHSETGFYADRFRKIDAEVTEEFREQLRKLPVPEPSNA
jgi:hypothetical protein